MKRKKQKSFYQIERVLGPKRLRLARSVDLVIRRIIPWLKAAIKQESRNDEFILRTKFRKSGEVEKFIRGFKKSGPRIRILTKPVKINKGSGAVFGVYIGKNDEIHIPINVKQSGMYYPVLFHELMHGTAYKGRVYRDCAAYSTKKRIIVEELTAEIGSLVLCQYFNVLTRRILESGSLSIFIHLSQLKNDKRYKMKSLFDVPDIGYVKEAVEYLVLK